MARDQYTACAQRSKSGPKASAGKLRGSSSSAPDSLFNHDLSSCALRNMWVSNSPHSSSSGSSSQAHDTGRLPTSSLPGSDRMYGAHLDLEPRARSLSRWSCSLTRSSMGSSSTTSASSAATKAASSASPLLAPFTSDARMTHRTGHWKKGTPLGTSRAQKTPTPPGPRAIRTESTSPPSDLIHSRSSAPRLNLSSSFTAGTSPISDDRHARPRTRAGARE